MEGPAELAEKVQLYLVTSREYYILKQIESSPETNKERKVPSIDEIFLTKYKGTVAKVREAIEKEEHKRFVPLATELDEEFNLVDVAAALISMVLDKEMGANYSEDNIGAGSTYVRLFLNIGRMDRINPRALLQFFSDNADTDKEDIGDIDIMEKFTFVNATSDAAKDIIKYCSGKRLMGRKVNIEISRPR